MNEVTKEQFYQVINPLDVHLHSYFHTNENRNYLDLRKESARVQSCDFKLKGIHLVGRTSIDYALPYDQQITKYYLDKKYLS